MQLSDIGGEFGFIDHIRATFAATKADGLTVPLGDDAAVLDVPPNRQVVVTTDGLVEGVHFRRDWSDPYSIGWKAAAVNLSDIAAMGADPTFAFVSLALPADETVEWLERLYDGLCDCLNRYGARLAGGDTNSSGGGLVITVTQLGTVPRGQALTRSGAKVGDILLVTGTLGDSGAGLALLSQCGAVQAEKINKAVVQSHRRPQPRVVAALAARETGHIHAAMDISDGLAGDLPKLCLASGGVGARINAAALPLSEALKAAAGQLDQSPFDLALDGGECCELLLVVAPGDVETVQAAVAATGTVLTPIGEVIRTGFRILGPDGTDLPTARRGWDHFAP
jgi:thiamine-monophosphate kinase